MHPHGERCNESEVSVDFEGPRDFDHEKGLTPPAMYPGAQ